MKEELEKLNTLQLKKIARLTYHVNFEDLKEKTKDELVAMLMSPEADVKMYGEASVLTLIQSFSQFGPWQQTEEEVKKEENDRLLQWVDTYRNLADLLESVVREKITMNEAVSMIVKLEREAQENDNRLLEKFYEIVLDTL